MTSFGLCDLAVGVGGPRARHCRAFSAGRAGRHGQGDCIPRHRDVALAAPRASSCRRRVVDKTLHEEPKPRQHAHQASSRSSSRALEAKDDRWRPPVDWTRRASEPTAEERVRSRLRMIVEIVDSPAAR